MAALGTCAQIKSYERTCRQRPPEKRARSHGWRSTRNATRAHAHQSQLRQTQRVRKRLDEHNEHEPQLHAERERGRGASSTLRNERAAKLWNSIGASNSITINV